MPAKPLTPLRHPHCTCLLERRQARRDCVAAPRTACAGRGPDGAPVRNCCLPRAPKRCCLQDSHPIPRRDSSGAGEKPLRRAGCPVPRAAHGRALLTSAASSSERQLGYSVLQEWRRAVLVGGRRWLVGHQTMGGCRWRWPAPICWRPF